MSFPEPNFFQDNTEIRAKVSLNIFEVGFDSLLLALDGKSVSIKEMITIDKSNI